MSQQAPDKSLIAAMLDSMKEAPTTEEVAAALVNLSSEDRETLALINRFLEDPSMRVDPLEQIRPRVRQAIENLFEALRKPK